jgi:hypothetical protein
MKPITVVGGAALALGVAAGTWAQSRTFTPIATFRVAADTVEIRGSHAYVAGGRTLTVLDLANPSAPARVGEYTFPEQIWSFRIAGPYAYVAANFFGLGILDLANPASPVLRSAFKTPGQAKGVAVVGRTVFVADHMSGVDVVDITSMEKPLGRGSFFVDGYARDVAASDRFAYAVDAPTGLYVLDPARSGSPDAVAQVQSASAPQAIEVLQHGQRILACIAGGGTLQIYDVTDAAKPSHVTTFRTPGRPARLALDGTLAYVADGREGLQVIELANPSAPVIVATFKTASPARDVAVGGGLVVVATGSAETGEEVVILR